MVGLYATATDTARALEYLRALEAEHAFWMAGADTVAPGSAARRVVRLRDGSVLNRYWDDRPEPRPESYREDYELGAACARREARAALPQHPRGGGEWMGFLEPVDARSVRPSHPRDDRARSDRSQQPALPRRAHDCRDAAQARRGGRRGGGGDVQCAGGGASSCAARGRLRLGDGLLLRRAVAHGRARHRPPDDGCRRAALLRARDAGAGTRRRGPPRPRLPLARRVRHDAHQVGAAVGRAERLAAAAVAGRRRRRMPTVATTSPTTRAHAGSRSTVARTA